MSLNIESLFEHLDEETVNFLINDQFKHNSKTVKEHLERALVELSKEDISQLAPEPQNIFKAFELCPISKVKVCLLGQDPFPGKMSANKGAVMKTVATGLSYSTNKGVPIQPSTRNMYKCLHYQKMIDTIPDHGDLTSWAKQGVLLLNSILTTLIGKSNVHKGIWKAYVQAIIAQLCDRNVTFIALGDVAKKFINESITKDVKIFAWGHPSPLNAMNQTDNPKNFLYSDVFTKVSAMMTINWDPDYLKKDSSNDLDHLKNNQEYLKNNHEEIKDIILPKIQDESEMPENDPTDKRIITPNTKKYSIFTDGAASANGSAKCRASWGFYVVQTIERKHIDIIKRSGIVQALEIAGEKYSSSNNRGELSAIMYAVEYILNNESLKGSFIEIVSDSQYSINCIEDWAPKWLANPTKHSLESKKNMDLIKPVINNLKIIRKTCRVIFKHVRSHKKAPNKDTPEWFYWNGNDIADKLCTSELNPDKDG